MGSAVFTGPGATALGETPGEATGPASRGEMLGSVTAAAGPACATAALAGDAG
jgi:hypothetical protein